MNVTQKTMYMMGAATMFGAMMILLQPSQSYGYLSSVAGKTELKKEVYYDDPCKTYLQKVVHAPSTKALAKSEAFEKTPTEKSRAAAAGILFGVKYALGPREFARESIARMSRAEAVKQYRNCHKERALKAVQNIKNKSEVL